MRGGGAFLAASCVDGPSPDGYTTAMRALVVGPALADFDPHYNRSIARGLLEEGYEVDVATFYVPTPPGLVNRVRIDLGMALGRPEYYQRYVRQFNRDLVERYRRLRPDVVIVVRGCKVWPETLEAMQDSARVLWCHDAPQRCGLDGDQLRGYETRFLFDPVDVAWLADAHGLDSEFLPVGYDPAVYHPKPHVEKDIDVFFIGAYYPERRETLELLARRLSHRRLRFYGRHIRYREPKTWAKAAAYGLASPGTFVNRSLDAPAIRDLYVRSRICLNMHHAQTQEGCNPRVFEILGSGAFQLCDELPYLRRNFDGIVPTYRGFDELCEKIETYLQDDGERERSASRGLERVLDEHTFHRRVQHILGKAGLRSVPV